MTDDENIAAMRAGSRNAANALARRYHDELNAFYRKRFPLELADELTQTTLLETVAKIDRFRGESSFRHYVFCVARRVMAEHHRKLDRQPRTEPAPSSEPPGARTSPSEGFVRAQRHEQLHRAIARLDEHHRSVLRLHVKGVSNHEIAAQLNLQYNTVRSRLSRAKEALRALLAPFVDEFLRVGIAPTQDEPS